VTSGTGCLSFIGIVEDSSRTFSIWAEQGRLRIEKLAEVLQIPIVAHEYDFEMIGMRER